MTAKYWLQQYHDLVDAAVQSLRRHLAARLGVFQVLGPILGILFALWLVNAVFYFIADARAAKLTTASQRADEAHTQRVTSGRSNVASADVRQPGSPSSVKTDDPNLDSQPRTVPSVPRLFPAGDASGAEGQGHHHRSPSGSSVSSRYSHASRRVRTQGNPFQPRTSYLDTHGTLLASWASPRSLGLGPAVPGMPTSDASHAGPDDDATGPHAQATQHHEHLSGEDSGPSSEGNVQPTADVAVSGQHRRTDSDISTAGLRRRSTGASTRADGGQAYVSSPLAAGARRPMSPIHAPQASPAAETVTTAGGDASTSMGPGQDRASWRADALSSDTQRDSSGPAMSSPWSAVPSDRGTQEAAVLPTHVPGSVAAPVVLTATRPQLHRQGSDKDTRHGHKHHGPAHKAIGASDGWFNLVVVLAVVYIVTSLVHSRVSVGAFLADHARAFLHTFTAVPALLRDVSYTIVFYYAFCHTHALMVAAGWMSPSGRAAYTLQYLAEVGMLGGLILYARSQGPAWPLLAKLALLMEAAVLTMKMHSHISVNRELAEARRVLVTASQVLEQYSQDGAAGGLSVHRQSAVRETETSRLARVQQASDRSLGMESAGQSSRPGLSSPVRTPLPVHSPVVGGVDNLVLPQPHAHALQSASQGAVRGLQWLTQHLRHDAGTDKLDASLGLASPAPSPTVSPSGSPRRTQARGHGRRPSDVPPLSALGRPEQEEGRGSSSARHDGSFRPSLGGHTRNVSGGSGSARADGGRRGSLSHMTGSFRHRINSLTRAWSSRNLLAHMPVSSSSVLLQGDLTPLPNGPLGSPGGYSGSIRTGDGSSTPQIERVRQPRGDVPLQDALPSFPYPANISLRDLTVYTLAPTLVYEPVSTYPRTTRVRPLYVAEKVVVTSALVFMGVLLFSNSMAPVLSEVCSVAAAALKDKLHDSPHHGGHRDQHHEGRVLLDAVARLALPTTGLMLIVFYVTFECICNACAEMSRFGDRGFYDDWWNSTTFAEFSRKWNKPVHEFLLRHVYLGCMGVPSSRVLLEGVWADQLSRARDILAQAQAEGRYCPEGRQGSARTGQQTVSTTAAAAAAVVADASTPTNAPGCRPGRRKRHTALAPQTALYLTFLVSIAVHEAILWGVLGWVTPWLALFSFLQFPLLTLLRLPVFRGKRLGNIVFWSGLIIGISTIIVLYAREAALDAAMSQM